MQTDSKILLNDSFLSYEEARKREWVVGNGLGGYASSTVIGLNTRKYHGLLVTSLEPPVKRWLLLSKIEEELSIEKDTYLLSTNNYGDVVHPQGYKHQVGFCFDVFPTFTYDIGGVSIEKSIFMPHGYNATVISYKIENAGKAFELRLRPLISSRDLHSNLHSSDIGWGFEEESGDNWSRLKASFEGAPVLALKCENAEYVPAGFWVYKMFYELEDLRGNDAWEDLYSPGEFIKRCEEGTTRIDIIATGGSADEVSRSEDAICSSISVFPEEERRRARALEKGISATGVVAPGTLALLARAADSFIVDRKSTGSKSIIAGYHWFSDWGRDAMISLPGIALVTGRFEEARDILRTFANSTEAGLVPNRFQDSGSGAEYNSADASLWFFVAVHKFLEYTGDYDFVMGGLWRTMKEIVDSYVNGTRFDIRMEEDGLISAGNGNTQLTWMDANVGEVAITPRHGKAVEINALWYNALKIMEGLALRFGEDSEEYAGLARKAKKSFNEGFWNPERNCLYDVISGDWKDGSIRPNQIFAVSLPHSLLGGKGARKVVLKVMEELYTPYGLRSLSPKDGRYCGTYGGNQEKRDAAYHQGTVWSWLMGPFISAYLSVNGRDKMARRNALRFISPLVNHLRDAGLGTVSEIFDGDAPFTPRGCISQAWGVGELLRCIVEDL